MAQKTRVYCAYCSGPLNNKVEPSTCHRCKTPDYRNPTPAVAVLLPYADQSFIAILRGNEPCIGELALPGGFVDERESGPEAAVREVLQETGLVCRLTKILYDGMPNRQSNIVLTIYLGEIIGGELAAGDDATWAGSKPIADAKLLCFNSHAETVTAWATGQELPKLE